MSERGGERDHFEVEYALRGIDKPVGVSGYQLSKTLPPELYNKLPDPKLLEEEIRKEMGEMSTLDATAPNTVNNGNTDRV